MLIAIRFAALGVVAAATSFQAIRSAAVDKYAGPQLHFAQMAWPTHPKVAIATSMSEIGDAAAKLRRPSSRSISRAMLAAKRAPLRPEPFVIAGAIALSENKPATAERLFVEAKRRDPRLSAARFFLAQQYFATNQPFKGLQEASALTRLVSGGPTVLAPALAQYAKEPGAVPHLRRMFAGNRELGEQVLAVLASDADNAELVLDLAGDDHTHNSRGTSPAWQIALLKALVGRGDFSEAHALWAKISKVPLGRKGLFNREFASLRAPAPFNWTLTSGDFGIVESVQPGSLQVIYYGRADAEFASQMLVLAPGLYEFRMQARTDSADEGAGGLTWTIACEPNRRRLLELPVVGSAGSSQRLRRSFTVPPACSAQVLALGGKGRDVAKPEQVVISDVQITKISR